MPIVDARHYNVLLISPSKPVTVELAPLLSHGLPLAPIHDINVYPNRRQLVDLTRKFEPALCFLDVTSGTEAFEVMADLQAVLPQVPVVALLANDNPDLVLQCLRQGSADFLMRPFTTDQIDACIDKLARLLPAVAVRGTGGKVITVIPAKGASGATTIACNLAHQCKRLGAKKILLGDMDPLTGTVSFLLKLKSTYSFMDVLQREGALDGDLWKQMVTTTGGIDVMLPPESIVDPIVDLQSAGPIVEYAQAAYEAVVLDAGGAYGNWNLSLARLCDELVLVTTTDLPSLQAAQRVITYFDHNRVDISKIRLVINRHIKDIGLNVDKLANAFNCEIFQTIPNDNDAVQRSLMEGKPISGSTALGKQLAGLADKLVNVKESESKKAASKSGIFSSMFSR